MYEQLLATVLDSYDRATEIAARLSTYPRPEHVAATAVAGRPEVRWGGGGEQDGGRRVLEAAVTELQEALQIIGG
jgi:hypothetical protein